MNVFALWTEKTEGVCLQDDKEARQDLGPTDQDKLPGRLE
jgi:hypothetical protein